MGFPIMLSTAVRPLAPSRRRSLRALALAALITIAPPTFAEEPLPGADIASVRDWLIANNPELRALQAEAEAAQARIYPAGALPDPMASIEWQEGDTYEVKQAFPLWGKRGLARDIASRQADAAGLERDATALTLLARAEAS